MTTRTEVLSEDPEVLGGVPIFLGTRVPIRALLDRLAGGATIQDFLDEFPSVSRENAEAVLALAREAIATDASGVGDSGSEPV